MNISGHWTVWLTAMALLYKNSQVCEMIFDILFLFPALRTSDIRNSWFAARKLKSDHMSECKNYIYTLVLKHFK